MSYLKKLQDSAKRKVRVRKLRKAGKTMAEIGKIMNLTPQRVQQILAEKNP